MHCKFRRKIVSYYNAIRPKAVGVRADRYLSEVPYFVKHIENSYGRSRVWEGTLHGQKINSIIIGLNAIDIVMSPKNCHCASPATHLEPAARIQSRPKMAKRGR